MIHSERKAFLMTTTELNESLTVRSGEGSCWYITIKHGEKFLGILFFSCQLDFLSQDNQREFVAHMHVSISSNQTILMADWNQ